MISSQSNKAILLLAAFGVLLVVATVIHQFDGVPEAWRVSFGVGQNIDTEKQHESTT
jgi:hypothetical protein